MSSLALTPGLLNASYYPGNWFGFEVWNSGFGVWGLGLGELVWFRGFEFGFGVWGLGFEVWGLRFRNWGFWVLVSSFGFLDFGFSGELLVLSV